MKSKILYVCLPLIWLFTACATLDSSCPYIISELHVELGENEGIHRYAGTYFELYNDSEKEMSNMTLSFLLYDQDGNTPFLGSNKVIAELNTPVPAMTSLDCIVSLDSFIATVPEEEYQVDYFYLSKITYADGSSWTDPFGMYALNGGSE